MFTLHSIYDPMCVTLTCDAVCRNVYSTQIMIVKVTPLSKHFTNSCAKLTQVTNSHKVKNILKCGLHKIECNLQFINSSN